MQVDRPTLIHAPIAARGPLGRAAVLGLLILAASLSPAPPAQPDGTAHAQVLGCMPDPDQTRIDLGLPTAGGANAQVAPANPSDSLGFHFTVAQPSAAALYIGDQWYDLDLYLYAKGRCATGWDQLIRAWSVRAERRVLQFMRPDEQIVNLPPGEYLLKAAYKAPEDPAADPFDPSKPFTARVALHPPYCGLSPEDDLVPNPAQPAIKVPKRPDDALYQLSLSIDPVNEKERVTFSLMTFIAVVSPPYGDLFDWEWVLDGQPVPDTNVGTYQIPVEGLPHTPGGQHTIQITARGVREYPDPWLTHVPPTLKLSCAFKVLTT